MGILTFPLIEHLLEGGSASQQEVDVFYVAVRAFYGRSYEYCVKWLRLDDDVLSHCVFVGFFQGE